MAKRLISLVMNHNTLATLPFHPEMISLQLAKTALQPVIAALQAYYGPFQHDNEPLQACNDPKTTGNGPGEKYQQVYYGVYYNDSFSKTIYFP